MSLYLRPCTIKHAQKWVSRVHRRLPKIQGGMWAIKVMRDGEVVGVAMVGNAIGQWSEDGVLCVLRVAVLEHQPNACSMLYGACSRTAQAMGATNLVTYTHQDEPGTSLRAAGWVQLGRTAGGEYDRPYRARKPVVDPAPKVRWYAPWSRRVRR